MRKAIFERSTKETWIKAELEIDGCGAAEISTGIGFFDHMLEQICRHGLLDMNITAEGDLVTGAHHTVEDAGIVIGTVLKRALGDKNGVRRFGNAIVPMDDALALCAVDLSGRAYLSYHASFTADKIENMELETIEEFFRAVADNAGMNIHIELMRGKNNHHMAEAMFKAFGRALADAAGIDPRIEGVLSTKGSIG